MLSTSLCIDLTYGQQQQQQQHETSTSQTRKPPVTKTIKESPKFHEYGLVCCVKMQHITVGINKATILTLKQSQPTCLLQKMKPTTKKLHITLKS